MTGDDRDLHDSFQSLRREEEASVPPISIHSLGAYEHGRRKLSGKVAAVTACAAAMLIAAAVVLLPGSHFMPKGWDGEREQGTASISRATITTWKPATDFLLDTPGRELLQDVPSIGEWHGARIGPGPGKGHPRISKQYLP